MKIIIVESEKDSLEGFEVVVEGNHELCSTIVQSVLYFVGVADFNMTDLANRLNRKEVKPLPKELEKKLYPKKKHHKWTNKEDRFMEEHYKEMGAKGINEFLPHLTRKQIVEKAHRSGLSKKQKKRGGKKE